MSESGKKAKKFPQQNQQQRLGKKVQIAKKDALKDKPEEKKPMILLKPKEKVESDEQEATVPVIAKPPVQVAVKPEAVKEEEPTCLPEMTKPCELIFSNFEVNRKASENLSESNVFFKVIGVIGTKGSGKSVILNFLAQERCKISDNRKIFLENRDSKSCSGLQMFITSDRTILLDFQEAFSNEADTIKMIMFALSLCHVLLIVQNDYLDMSLMRHVIFAEMMKFNTGNRLSPEGPKIIFVKNRTTAQDIARESRKIWEKTLEKIFSKTELNIYTEYLEDSAKKASKNTAKCIKQINLIEFPDLMCKNYVNCVDLDSAIEQLTCSVFRQMKNVSRVSQAAFTEKMWWQLALSLAETHKTEYFLRKYDHLTTAINSTAASDGHGKDRYALNYHVES
ncbi:nonsense-mediated mRNA decay factor SMG9 [Phlebotomus argentipes]|uniref:nonsense-mediated mRNA decay factor SMG9 n=1 Tax=Phlebotomus argentipes TaxID=94469 RepID=UPI002892E85A|nr:nonsense-mediated mRNA decay factor SMG9 [Phlebotomus argentipes]